MGHTIWVEVHGRPLKETADDSSTMHRLMDNLDVLAGKLDVRKAERLLRLQRTRRSLR